MMTVVKGNLTSRGCLRWLWLTIVVIALDQISKSWILNHFVLYQVKVILPFFSLVLAYNKGAAFSFLNNQGDIALYLFGFFSAIISLFLLGVLVRLPKNRRFVACALVLIIGGALGNLIDRIMHGHVIDFILLHWENYYWPAFNVADSAITIGVIMLLIDAFFLRSNVKQEL